MQINTHEHQMVGDAVDNAPFAAFSLSQTRELTIRVVERIRANMEHHAYDVDAQITIIIKMSRNDAADTAQQCHSRGRHLESREKLGEPEPQRPVKIQIEDSLYLARFVGGYNARMRGLCRLSRQFAWRKNSRALLL